MAIAGHDSGTKIVHRMRHREAPSELGERDPPEGASLTPALPAFIVEGLEIVEARTIAVLRRGELGVEIGGRSLRPRTDLVAPVAAGHHVAHHRREPGRDLVAVLDRQIADAAPGVEHVGLGKRVGGAGVEADRAGAAVRGGRAVGLELEIGEQRAEKEL